MTWPLAAHKSRLACAFIKMIRNRNQGQLPLGGGTPLGDGGITPHSGGGAVSLYCWSLLPPKSSTHNPSRILMIFLIAAIAVAVIIVVLVVR